MDSTAPTTELERQLRDMNEALLVSSVHQHELTEMAEEGQRTQRELAEKAQRAEAMIQCQKDSLEMVVKGEPLERVLDFLARAMEGQSQGRFVVAIHLMEADGYHFGHVAAPSLPARYAQATRGMDARLELGACSSAVVSHTPTIVRDFAAQTRWPAFSAEVVSLGLRGCFTTPILSPDQNVLGTFAIYYRQPGDPSPQDQQLVDFVTSTVALAIERKQTEQALRASEERFRTLFDLGPVAVYTCDASGVIREFNGRAAELWGRAPALGDTDERFCGSFRMIRPDGSVLAHEQCPMADVLSGRVSHVRDREVSIERPDGSRVMVVVSIRPLKNEKGEITGAINCFYDITERKRHDEALRESEERFRTLADNISQLAWICDKFGNVTWYNRRWLDYTGMTFEEMRGWGWVKVQHPDHVERVVEGVRLSARISEPWEDTFPLRGKDGEYRWFLSRALPIRDKQGNVLRWFGTNTDVTEQREMESRIKQQAEQLAGESRRKDEFLAMLGHELRNPLAPIANAVQLLRLQRGSESPIEQQARTIIERQVGQLQNLVDDLLEVSRITSGRVRLRQERVAVTGIVERAVETARPLVVQRRHELTVSLPPQPVWLYVDAARLEQVVVNLLTNAAKYTDEGGHIWLTVELASGGRQPPDECVLRVRDTGIGIAPELLPRIFDLFTQAERSLDRSEGGLGIGLCLVQRLVELHGGTVEVSSVVGEGSEFVVRLPLMKEEGQRTKDQGGTSLGPSPSVPDTSRRVLVVDDNVDAAESLAMLLRALGHEVRTAHDGPAALEAALDYRPDVVLLDIGLPGLDGFEVAKRMRQQPALKNLVLVAMTGYGQESDRQRSLEVGFDRHLVKPIEFGELQKVLATVSKLAT